MPEGKKVYAVTESDYDYYDIIAIFSTDEMRRKFLARLLPNHGYEEEEWNVDEYSGKPLPFQVNLRRNGRGKSTIKFWPYRDGNHFVMFTTGAGYTVKGGQARERRELYLECHVMAKDANEALEVANKKRLQIIADGKWQAGYDSRKEG